MCLDVAKTVNTFCFHFPPSPLRSFIERFWYWKETYLVSHTLWNKFCPLLPWNSSLTSAVRAHPNP